MKINENQERFGLDSCNIHYFYFHSNIKRAFDEMALDQNPWKSI